ncbi:SET domain-containing protein 4, partial [Stegodyphus mimosarum]
MKKHCGRTYRKRRNKKIKPSAVSNVPSEANQNLSLLLKWMGMKGFKAAKKLHPAIFIDTGRGLMTKDSINSGDLIVAIPQNLLITPHKVLKSHLGNFFKRYCPQASGHQILSVFLICEKFKGVSSDWCHYIETLPKTYSIPAYLNQHSLSVIPEFLIGQALDQVMLCKNSYEQLKLLLQNLEASCHLFKGALDFDVYKWAWCSVNTRCIFIDCDKNHCIGKLCTYHLALAPFLDLLNHSAHVQV